MIYFMCMVQFFLFISMHISAGHCSGVILYECVCIFPAAFTLIVSAIVMFPLIFPDESI